MFPSISNVSTSIAATWFSYGPPPVNTIAVTTTTTTTTTTITTAVSDFNFSQKPPLSNWVNSTVPVSVASTPFTSTVNSIITPVMTYNQLKELINRWSIELQIQENRFLHQAAQVNAWDRILIENSEKITILHGEVEKMKLDQKRLETELDFVLWHQNAIEDLLIPLEESLKDQSRSVYLKHADQECERTYRLAANIDAQLKRMAQDLRDITVELNILERPADTTDPILQICRIMNAQMDALEWISQNSDILQRKVEEVAQISRMVFTRSKNIR